MNETFGQRFLRLRKEANLTQEDIAKKLNITAQAVSKWENDVSYPDISLLGEIANIFNISIDELLGNETKKAVLLDKEEKKDINSLSLIIRVQSNDGDKVKLNLPMQLLIACGKAGIDAAKLSLGGKLDSINFDQIIALVEQGVIGKLLEVNSADGDIVEIYVQ